MQKEVNIYEINCIFEGKKVYFKNKKKIGTFNFNYDEYDYNDIEDI